MSAVSREPPLSDRVAPHAKVWLEVDGQYVFGRGMSEILKAVEQTGSIKAAAGQLGKSYRYVWAKIKRAEQALGAPLIRTHVGGRDTRRSELSELARDLVRDFDGLRQRVFELVDREFRGRLRSTLKGHGDP